MKTKTAKTYKISLTAEELNTLRKLAKRCAAKYENTLSTFGWKKDAAELEAICEKAGDGHRVELTWKEAEKIRGLSFTCCGQYLVFGDKGTYDDGFTWRGAERILDGITKKAEAAGFDTFDEN